MGPGSTRYVVNETGGINQIRWDDPSWETKFLWECELKSPKSIASALRRAYLSGWDDRGVAVRSALGVTTP